MIRFEFCVFSPLNLGSMYEQEYSGCKYGVIFLFIGWDMTFKCRVVLVEVISIIIFQSMLQQTPSSY